MLRDDKEAFVAQMRDDVSRAAGILFLDYTGLTVAEANKMRRKFQEEKVQYQVVKNTLMTLVLADTPYADAAKYLKGSPTGVVIGYDDPVTAAKLTYEFLKDCEHLKVKGGVVDKKAISSKETEKLSKLPSKAEVLGEIIRLALSPASNLLGQIKNPAGRIVGAIEAKADQGE